MGISGTAALQALRDQIQHEIDTKEHADEYFDKMVRDEAAQMHGRAVVHNTGQPCEAQVDLYPPPTGRRRR